MSTLDMPRKGYRASLVKRRPLREPEIRAPGENANPASRRPRRDLDAELREEKRARLIAEREAIARIDRMTLAWNEELSSSVLSLGAVVSRAVGTIVGAAPREDVVLEALRKEVARVRSDHQPVLRVSRRDDGEWIERLEAKPEASTFSIRRDDAISPGKCVLELGARRVDISPETQIAAFDDKLRGTIGQMPPRAVPPLPDVEIATPEVAPPVRASTLAPPAPAPTNTGAKATSVSVKRGSGKRVRAAVLPAPVLTAPTIPETADDGARVERVARAAVTSKRKPHVAAGPVAAKKPEGVAAPDHSKPAPTAPREDDAPAPDLKPVVQLSTVPSDDTTSGPVGQANPDGPVASPDTAADRNGSQGTGLTDVPHIPASDDAPSTVPAPSATNAIAVPEEREPVGSAFDELDLGENAARFSKVPEPISGDEPKLVRPETEEAGDSPTEKIKALRERLVDTARSLRDTDQPANSATPSPASEDAGDPLLDDLRGGAFGGSLPPFRKHVDRDGFSREERETGSGLLERETPRRDNGGAGDLIRRAIGRGRPSDVEQDGGAAAAAQVHSKVSSASTSASGVAKASEAKGEQLEAGGSLNLPPRIAELIAKARSS